MHICLNAKNPKSDHNNLVIRFVRYNLMFPTKLDFLMHLSCVNLAFNSLKFLIFCLRGRTPFKMLVLFIGLFAARSLSGVDLHVALLMDFCP